MQRLLARVGHDGDGPYIHLKSHRGNRSLSEVTITEGTVKIRCLSCEHWTVVHVRKQGIDTDSAVDEILVPDPK